MVNFKRISNVRMIQFVSLLFYQLAEFETGDFAARVFGAVLGDVFLAFDRNAETAALAFFHIVPVYFVLEEIQKKASDNHGADDPNGETNEMKHRIESSQQLVVSSQWINIQHFYRPIPL